MTDLEIAALCPGCFAAKGQPNPCPHCGYEETAPRSAFLLPHRAQLNDQFVVGRVLGKPGGFGVTYLGWDLSLQTRVAVKEYLPRELAGRAGDHATVAPHSQDDGELFRFGLEQFLREARTLAQLDHPNLVRVRNFFEANGTAYLVMDYYRGLTLAEYLDRQGGRVPEDQAKQLMLPILDGLRAVHAKGFLHRDIKPQNIYLARLESGGVRPILLDFGAARQAMGERSRSMSAVVSAGYAPFEQYHGKGTQGPWTDVYSTAAVIYRMVTGETPPEATERRDQDNLRPASDFGVSQTLSQAIGEAMAQTPEVRPQTAHSFQALLAGSALPPSTPTAVPTAIPPATPPPTATPPFSPAWIVWWILAVLLGAGGGFAWWESDRPEQKVPLAREREAQRQQDDAAYAAAQRDDTGDGYLAYLSACAASGCGHKGEAEQRLAGKLRAAREQEMAEIQAAAEKQLTERDDALFTTARRGNTEADYRQYLGNCRDTGCAHLSEASRGLAQLEQRQQAEERRQQAPVAKVRAYFDYVRNQQVTDAIACLNSPGRSARTIIENIRSAQINELRLNDIDESTATVWIDWTGATRDGEQQRWRGPIPLLWNGSDWKIVTFKYLAKP